MTIVFTLWMVLGILVILWIWLLLENTPLALQIISAVFIGVFRVVSVIVRGIGAALFSIFTWVTRRR